VAPPRRNCLVTSTSSEFLTRARPSSTSAPFPPTISCRARGVLSPPSCSGQTGTRHSSSRRLNTCSSRFALLASQVHVTPSRHALTSVARFAPCLFCPSDTALLLPG
jgi:hypothetical protein